MTNEYLANRYGKTASKVRNQRILWTAVGALLLALFMVWALMVNFATPAKITAEIKNFTVQNELQTEVTIKVSNPTKQDGVCAINVLDVGYAVVGYKEIEVPGSLGATPVISTSVNTNNLAVSATVDTCRFK